jgi:hypothetical protein
MNKMTLDTAVDRFEAAPHLPENTATLLNVALRYWQNHMISDDTFANYVRDARDWIKQVPIQKPAYEEAIQAIKRCASGELERPLTERSAWPDALRKLGEAIKYAD